jgi:hypothetical protein
MPRTTIADLDRALADLSDLTGEAYTRIPSGSGYWSVYVGSPTGPREVANRRLADLVGFLDAYRRGYGAARDREAADHAR